ncbi:hypothetical protein AB3N02_21845 [Priestia aryabhattai]|uniref:hypothetical protein n=1 Tax=Priestia aryabhattai TaxID=412384 RepID=UPI0039A03826
MTEDKNILKGNKQADFKVVRNHKFYAVIEVKMKNERDGKTTAKTIIVDAEGTRMEAKNELEAIAKAQGGKVTYFGGFVN